MHVDWIRRAYEAGLRVMCALVNNSELFGSINPVEGHPINDRAVTDLVLRATNDFVAAQPWMEVARTSADARRIVADDRLAVMLGLEIDSLAGWGTEADCTADDVRAELTRLKDEFGVAMVIPIHLADNAFGGASIYNDFFAVNSRVLRGVWQSIEDARGATSFKLFETPLESKP